MKLKLARTTISAKPKAIELDKLEEDLDKKSIFYFDKENSHKDLVELVEHFENKSLNVYLREVRFGLSENDYMYEVHIL